MPITDKLILTVESVLSKKYGREYPTVLSLINKLIASDKGKGLNSSLIFLDDKTQLSSLRIRTIVPGKSTKKDYKNCIDALYHHFNPDYILILGAVDVIPQQLLYNPVYRGDPTDDRWVPSDLPYACNSPYSSDPNSFLSPVRVVGRLADINGIADLDLVTNSINNIIAFSPKPKKIYESYFAVSVPLWRRSTDESVKAIYSSARVNLVPPGKDHWKASQLKPLSHFFNCHGAESEPYWYGQIGESFPKAMTSTKLSGKVKKNTIVAAECCYGAELYRPAADKLPHSMPICNAYFKNGAIALLGSTTAAYGPSTINNQADLMTQYFMMNILGGASTGRALLEARQKYIFNHGPDLSPFDLKTLSQFNLLGDPSLQIVTGKSDQMKKSVGIKSKSKKVFVDSSRKERRRYLLSKGIAIQGFVNHLQRGKKLDAGKKTRLKLHQLLADFKMHGTVGKTFKVRQNAINKRTFLTTGMSSVKFHVFLEKNQPGNFRQKLLSVKEMEGNIVDVQLYNRK